MSIWIKNDWFCEYCLFAENFQYLIPVYFYLASERLDS